MELRPFPFWSTAPSNQQKLCWLNNDVFYMPCYAARKLYYSQWFIEIGRSATHWVILLSVESSLHEITCYGESCWGMESFSVKYLLKRGLIYWHNLPGTPFYIALKSHYKVSQVWKWRDWVIKWLDRFGVGQAQECNDNQISSRWYSRDPMIKLFLYWNNPLKNGYTKFFYPALQYNYTGNWPTKYFLQSDSHQCAKSCHINPATPLHGFRYEH